MSNNHYVIEHSDAVWRLTLATRIEELKIEALEPQLRNALRKTMHRVRRLEQDCRIHYRGNAIMLYKICRVQLMASRRHLLNLIKRAKGESVEEGVSPWSQELGLSKIPPKMRREWQENAANTENARARLPVARIVDIKGNTKTNIYKDNRSKSYYSPLLVKTRSGRKHRSFKGERSPITLLDSIKKHHKEHGNPEGADKWRLAQAVPFPSALFHKLTNQYLGWDIPGVCKNVSVMIKDLPHWGRRELEDEYRSLAERNLVKLQSNTQRDNVDKLQKAIAQQLRQRFNVREPPEAFERSKTLQRFSLAQDAKLSKAEAQYQDGRNNDTLNHCRDCQHYDGNHGCSIVEGIIDPDGVCNKFAARTAKAALINDMPHSLFPNKEAAEKTLQKMHELDPHDNWIYKIVRKGDIFVIDVYDDKKKFVGTL